MEHTHRNAPTDTTTGDTASGSPVITVRGPVAGLLVTVLAAPWGVGMYVIVRAVITHLSSPAQPPASRRPARRPARRLFQCDPFLLMGETLDTYVRYRDR
jgi:hypothetical protein